MSEQLFLFEDRLTLLNRGILDLTKLNLSDARMAFERYKGLYHDESKVELELRVIEFFETGFTGAPEPCSETPAYLCSIWNSFEKWRRSAGFIQEKIVDEMKLSFFQKVAETIHDCNLTNAPFLSESLPTGYVYIQVARYDQAVKALQSCIPIRPNSAAIYGYLGDAYLLRGEPAVAGQCYLEACLIDSAGIDWNHLRDDALLELKENLSKQHKPNASLALEWLPSHACIQGLLRPKKLKLHEGAKEFVDEYLQLRKDFFKKPTPELKAKLFFRGIILCHNEPLLKFVKGVDFIDARRLMKAVNPDLFAKYLKWVGGKV